MKSLRVLSGLALPEGIRWRDEMLWLSDIFGGRVLQVDRSGEERTIAVPDDRPSGLGFLSDGSLLIALTTTRRVMRVNDGHMELHADVSEFTNAISDMVSAPDGRTYVGTGSRNSGPTTSHTILVVHPDGRVETAASGIPRANGIAITPDGQSLVYGATDEHLLVQMRITKDGLLEDVTTFADLGDVVPDGVCLDEDRNVWVAAKDDGFLLVAEGGRILDRLPVVGGTALACVLGGPSRRTLFMAAREGTNDSLTAEAATGEVAPLGFVESADVATPGAGWP